MPKPEYNVPYKDLEPSDARRSTSKGTVKAGKYVRKTITLPQSQVDYIAQQAQEHGFGILAFYRWLIDTGLIAYEGGDTPTVVKKPEHNISLKHHTSKD